MKPFDIVQICTGVRPLLNKSILCASQNIFYFGNLDLVFCCHIFGYNKKKKKKKSRITVCKLIQN